MDSSILGAAISIIKSIPGTDISRAEAAAKRAEDAATVAVVYGKSIEISGTGLIIGERRDN